MYCTGGDGQTVDIITMIKKSERKDFISRPDCHFYDVPNSTSRC